jgi:hypothetical protein
LLASILFGTIWTWQNVDTAIVAFGIGLVISMAFAAAALRLSPEAAAVE